MRYLTFYNECVYIFFNKILWDFIQRLNYVMLIFIKSKYAIKWKNYIHKNMKCYII